MLEELEHQRRKPLLIKSKNNVHHTAIADVIFRRKIYNEGVMYLDTLKYASEETMQTMYKFLMVGVC
jgi:hypothetical protein